MALGTPTKLSGAIDTNNTTTCVAPSSSPTGGALLVVVGSAIFSGSGETVTITDGFTGTGSWTKIQTEQGGGSPLRYVVTFLAYAKAGTTPGSGTVTATWSSATRDKSITAIQITGQHATTPVPQSKTNGGTGSSLTVTLDSTPASTSCVIGVVADKAQSGSPGNGTGFTQLDEQQTGTGTGDVTHDVQYDLTSADTTCDWTSLAAEANAAVAIEIAEASTGSTYEKALTMTRNMAATPVNIATFPRALTMTRNMAQTPSALGTFGHTLNMGRSMALTPTNIATLLAALTVANQRTLTLLGNLATSTYEEATSLARSLAMTPINSADFLAVLAQAKNLGLAPVGSLTLPAALTQARSLGLTFSQIADLMATLAQAKSLGLTPDALMTIEESLPALALTLAQAQTIDNIYDEALTLARAQDYLFRQQGRVYGALNGQFDIYEIAGQAGNDRGSYYPAMIQDPLNDKLFRKALGKVTAYLANPGWNATNTTVEADYDDGTASGWVANDWGTIEYRVPIHDGVTGFQFYWAYIHHLNDYTQNQCTITVDGYDGHNWTTLATDNPLAAEEAFALTDYHARNLQVSVTAGQYKMARWKWEFTYLTSGDGMKLNNLDFSITSETHSQDDVPNVESATLYTGTGTSISQAVDMGSYTDPALMVILWQYHDGADPGVSSLTYNGSALTLATTQMTTVSTKRYRVSAYILDAPATGSNTLAGTLTNTTEFSFIPYVLSNTLASSLGYTGGDITTDPARYEQDVAVNFRQRNRVFMAVATRPSFAPLYSAKDVTVRTNTESSNIARYAADFPGANGIGAFLLNETTGDNAFIVVEILAANANTYDEAASLGRNDALTLAQTLTMGAAITAGKTQALTGTAAIDWASLLSLGRQHDYSLAAGGSFTEQLVLDATRALALASGLTLSDSTALARYLGSAYGWDSDIICSLGLARNMALAGTAIATLATALPLGRSNAQALTNTAVFPAILTLGRANVILMADNVIAEVATTLAALLGDTWTTALFDPDNLFPDPDTVAFVLFSDKRVYAVYRDKRVYGTDAKYRDKRAYS